MRKNLFFIKSWKAANAYYLDKIKDITYIRPETVKYFKMKEFPENTISTELRSLAKLHGNGLQDFLKADDISDLDYLVVNWEIADDLYEKAFKNVDEENILQAVNDFLKIGFTIKDVPIKNLINYDDWKAKKDEKVKSKVVELVKKFVYDYGLLGILNSPLSSLARHYGFFSPHKAALNLETDTFIGEILKKMISCSEDEENIQMNTRLFNKTAKIGDYIKIFFPDISKKVINDFADFSYRSPNYWTNYSEPISYFLLTARYFHMIVPTLRGKILGGTSDGDNSTQKNILENITVSFCYEYIVEIKAYRAKLQFDSLYDIMLYSAIRSTIEGTKTYAVCRHCGVNFIADNNRALHCTLGCQRAYKQKVYREEKKKKGANGVNVKGNSK